MKNRDVGKRNEKALTKYFNNLGYKADRKGIFGGEDVSMGLFSIEAKSRKKCVVTGWFEQAERNCPDDKTPLVDLHIHGQRRGNDIVMLRLRDFEDLFGRLDD